MDRRLFNKTVIAGIIGVPTISHYANKLVSMDRYDPDYRKEINEKILALFPITKCDNTFQLYTIPNGNTLWGNGKLYDVINHNGISVAIVSAHLDYNDIANITPAMCLNLLIDDCCNYSYVPAYDEDFKNTVQTIQIDTKRYGPLPIYNWNQLVKIKNYTISIDIYTKTIGARLYDEKSEKCGLAILNTDYFRVYT